MFVLIDAWFLFFSKKENVLVELRRKNVCRSGVVLVETHSIGVPLHSFSVFWRHRVT